MAYSSKYTEQVLNQKKKKKQSTSTSNNNSDVGYSSNYTKNVIDGNYNYAFKTKDIRNVVNNDIAPVKEDKDKKWYKKIFSKGEFDDGYDFGDVTKTILGTATDLTQDVTKGVISILESPLDVATNMVASTQNILGYKDAAEKTRKFANRDLSQTISSRAANVTPVGMLYNIVNGTPENIINPVGIKYDEDKSFGENVKGALKDIFLEDVKDDKTNYENSSLAGHYVDKTAELVGYTMALAYGSGALTKATGTTKFGSSKIGSSISGGNIGLTIAGHTLNLPTLAIISGTSSALQEANSKEGATEVERWTKALSGGLIEGTTEGLFGMFGVGGNEITDVLGEKIAKKFTSSAGKALAKVGFSSSGEAAEEFLSYAFNYLVDNNLIDKMGEADFSQEWDWAEVGEQMALAFVSSAIMQGGSTKINTNEAIKSAEEQLGRKLTAEEKGKVTQAVIESIFENKYNQLQEQNAIQNEVQNVETNTSLNNISNQITKLENQLNTSQSAVQQQEILNKINALEQQYNAIQQQEQINKLKENELPVKKANVEEVKPITTQETNSNLATEVESNTLNNVKSEQFDTKVNGNNQNIESEYKSKQLEVINNSNPADDSYHTWIRSTDDIKTFEEAFFEDGEYSGMDPDFTESMAQESKETGKIIVYSSYPIENGVFVTPSQLEASQYAGGDASKLYSKEVNINDVAWIDGAEGQYAKVEETSSLRSQETDNSNQKNTEKVKKNDLKSENKTPTQQELDSLEDIRENKSGSEYADAFYNLEKKYGKANLYKGLNEYKSTGKSLNTEQVVEEVSEQVEEAIAPVRETIEEVKDTIDEVKKLTEELAPLKDYIEQSANLQNQKNFNSLEAQDIALIENTTPEYQYENDNVGNRTTVESPIKTTYEEAGKRNVNAYQYEHPEVKPFFQLEARAMENELINDYIPGERFVIGDMSQVGNGDYQYSGTTRTLADDIASLKDTYNYSKNDLIKGLDAIIKDKGAENIAVAKRLELLIDERLRNGYTDTAGYKILANQNYINLLKSQEWSNYYSSISTENIPSAEKNNIENQIDNALSNNRSKSKNYLGEVTNKVADKIKSLLGMEVGNRKHVLSDNDIRHMMKQHGNQNIESQKGQIAITKEDIKRIPDIISNPTDIVKGSDNKLGQTIRYLKRYNDNTTYVVEVVPDNSNALIIKTMWKKPSALTNSIAPSSTSETKGSDISSTFNDIISQNMKNVNDIAPVKERYEAITPKENFDNGGKMIKISPEREAFNKAVEQSAREIEKELGYIPKDPTKASTYEDLTDTSENQKIAEILSEEPTVKNKEQRLWATVKANLLDKGAVFEDLSIKNKNRELMGKWDYTLTSEARAQNVIGNGHTEYNTDTKEIIKTSKSLNDIRAEVDNTGLTKDFYEYMYHKHNVDRMSLSERFEGIENKAVFGDEITSELSQKIVDRYENTHPEFMDYAQDVYDYLDGNKKELVNNGVISQETADLWSEMYPHYVPIRRVDDTGTDINVPLDTQRTGVNAPIKKATGGNSNILPLFDTMAMRTLQTYRAVAKNNFGVELKNTLGTTIDSQQTNIDEVIDSIDTQESLLQENNGKPTFTVFENGEKVTFSITQDMYDALKPISDSSLLSKTIKPLNAASNFHRGVLTEYNPVFMLTNSIKDAQDVLMNSQHAAKTYAKIPEAYAQILKKGYWYQEYVSKGGEQNSYFDSQENTFKTENKGIKKLLDLPPLSTISKINNIIEMAPRLAEYIASRESGRSAEVSMLDAARVTTNFKAGGNITKWANRNGATFLNASVQGAMQQVRNIREAKMNGLRGWMNLATKFTIAGLPALLLNGLLWDDDDDYDELSDYVKQNYYVVAKDDEGNFIRIPKGRTVAVIQNAFEQISDALSGNDEIDLKEFMDLALNNLAPNNPIDNNILAPITQVMNNKTWYGNDLVPTSLQDLPANEQYDESTDLFSKWFGETFNVSPIKVNYLLDQYSGGIGDVVLPMMTPEATSDADSLGDYLIAPFKNKFTTNSIMNNKNISEFYETKEELTTNAKSKKATDEDVLKNKYFNSINSELSKLYKEKREIQNSSLSKSEKYEKVQEIQKQINEMSKEALNTYEKGNHYDSYASIGNHQYYKNINEDGETEWKEVNDKEAEDLSNLEMTTGDLNIYFKKKQEFNKLNDKYYEAKNELKETYGEGSDEYSNALSELYMEKKNTIIDNISNSYLPDEAKAYLYDKYYSNNATDTIISSGINLDYFFDYEKNDFKADYNAKGKAINGSRKSKVVNYINGYDLSVPQKAILIKLTNTFKFNDYNNEIINYVNNLDVSYEKKMSILKSLDMEILDDGTITWK